VTLATSAPEIRRGEERGETLPYWGGFAPLVRPGFVGGAPGALWTAFPGGAAQVRPTTLSFGEFGIPCVMPGTTLP
jgi:hypothetical protein